MKIMRINSLCRKIGKKLFVNQARVLTSFQLTTEKGKRQHLYLIGETSGVFILHTFTVVRLCLGIPRAKWN